MKRIFTAFAILLVSGCSKQAPKTIAVPENDSLKITVYGEHINPGTNITTGPPISGATVKLYQSPYDLVNRQNQVGNDLITGRDGSVTFSNLRSIAYYYYAQKGCETNQVVDPQPNLGSATGYALINGRLNVASTQIRNSGNVRIVNRSGFTFSVVLQNEFWVDEHGPRYEFTLANNQAKSYTGQPTGYYFITASSQSAADIHASIQLTDCGSVVSYELK
jgi:hypothetical protein